MGSEKVARQPDRPTGRRGASEILHLQRTAGNRAVTQLIGAAAGRRRPHVQRHPEVTENAEVGEAAVAEATTEEVAETTEAAETAEPGTGTTGTSGGALTGDARKKAIEDILRASATGMWALGVIEKWSVPVNYEFVGTGSFHRTGSIFINKTLSPGAAAMVMMHEAQHANTFKSGKAADIKALGRAEYVKKKIADEAEAVVRQIEGYAVTKSLGVDIAGGGMTDDLKQRYLKVFYAKRDELEKADPKMTRAEINDRCRTHARDTEVTSWFHDGTFVTSTGGAANVTYSDHYGKQWDGEHNKPGKK